MCVCVCVRVWDVCMILFAFMCVMHMHTSGHTCRDEHMEMCKDILERVRLPMENALAKSGKPRPLSMCEQCGLVAGGRGRDLHSVYYIVLLKWMKIPLPILPDTSYNHTVYVDISML